MTSTTEIADAVGQAVRRHLSPDRSTALDNLDAPLADLGIDSLGMVGLILDIERSLGVQFDSGVLTAENFATLRAATDTVIRACR